MLPNIGLKKSLNAPFKRSENLEVIQNSHFSVKPMGQKALDLMNPESGSSLAVKYQNATKEYSADPRPVASKHKSSRFGNRY
mmetsp:Transcript_13347/g.13126  ORF Transcript_13347/g.13126 Transcript_13347/m.13126 type:complete len:82 (+) Transcript_13347:641-886(+)